jgi:hypothetical protein
MLRKWRGICKDACVRVIDFCIILKVCNFVKPMCGKRCFVWFILSKLVCAWYWVPHNLRANAVNTLISKRVNTRMRSLNCHASKDKTKGSKTRSKIVVRNYSTNALQLQCHWPCMQIRRAMHSATPGRYFAVVMLLDESSASSSVRPHNQYVRSS